MSRHSPPFHGLERGPRSPTYHEKPDSRFGPDDPDSEVPLLRRMRRVMLIIPMSALYMHGKSFGARICLGISLGSGNVAQVSGNLQSTHGNGWPHQRQPGSGMHIQNRRPRSVGELLLIGEEVCKKIKAYLVVLRDTFLIVRQPQQVAVLRVIVGEDPLAGTFGSLSSNQPSHVA